MIHREWHAHCDADRADRQEFDRALDADRAERTDAFHRGQTHHLRAMKEQLAWTAAAGVHGEMRDGLAEQLVDGLARRVVGDIERVDIDDLADVACGGGRMAGWFRCCSDNIHTRFKVTPELMNVEAQQGRSFSDNASLRGWDGLLIVGT